MSVFARFTSSSRTAAPSSDASPRIAETADERALTVELARLLAATPKTPPVRASKSAHTEWDDEPIGNFADPERDEDFEDAAEAEHDASEPPPVPVPPQATQPDKAADMAFWEKSSKRAHFRKATRQAASWIISIGVGGFIIAVVALILLGPPGNLDARKWLSHSKTVASTDISAKRLSQSAPVVETRAVRTERFSLGVPAK